MRHAAVLKPAILQRDNLIHADVSISFLSKVQNHIRVWL
jgi:hypothetical protein